MAFKQFFSALFLLAAVAFVAPAIAQDADPVLKISGTIDGKAGSVTMTRSDLEKMEQVSIKTSTPWNEGVVDFVGVPMKDLLKAAGVSGANATVIALNDYSSDVPTEDFDKYNVILAIKRNGAYMPVDDQGPFFIIYPYDSDKVLQNQPYYGRSVWQVKEISVQ